MDTMTLRDPAAAIARDSYARAREKMLLFDLEGYVEAVPLFGEAIKSQPDNALAHAALAQTYAFWGFREELNGLESQSYYNFAYRGALLAVQLGPEMSETHRAMAVALRKGEYCNPAQRQREAALALELDPYDGESCHECWKAFGADISDQRIYKAIALCPSLLSAHLDLGVALCERGRLDEAAYHLGCALKLNPRNSLAHYDLAMIRMRQGRLAESEELLVQALDMHPGDALLLSGIDILSPGQGGKTS
ncbi:MAG: tetratricopeptide repeat protein [Elusimicrobia bacterium]|nr:tetratricopeptide repeat protein [Elusimicrobiota bacterium]